jgi:hypothetical protein
MVGLWRIVLPFLRNQVILKEKELISDVVGSFGQIHLDLSSSFWADAQLARTHRRQKTNIHVDFPYLV